jgi:hypothetical protein
MGKEHVLKLKKGDTDGVGKQKKINRERRGE